MSLKGDQLEILFSVYCKFGIFCDNFIFANGIVRRICDVKNSEQRHDLLISVNDRVILPLQRVLFSRNLAYAKFRENKTLAKISEFTVTFTFQEFQTEQTSEVSALCEMMQTASTSLTDKPLHVIPEDVQTVNGVVSVHMKGKLLRLYRLLIELSVFL